MIFSFNECGIDPACLPLRDEEGNIIVDRVTDKESNMTDKRIKEPCPFCGNAKETIERYKPVTLQEHDAEPRKLRAILDVKTNDIYILKTTKGFVEIMGVTIEDRNDDAEREGEK